MGYSPRGLNESDTTERLHSHFTVTSSTINLSSVTYVSGFVMIVCESEQERGWQDLGHSEAAYRLGPLLPPSFGPGGPASLAGLAGSGPTGSSYQRMNYRSTCR